MFSACVVWITDLQDFNDNMHNLVSDVPQKNCTLFHKRYRQSNLTPQLWYMGI